MQNYFGLMSLGIDNVKHEDSGRYTCVVSNSEGETACSCNMEVRGERSRSQRSVLPRSRSHNLKKNGRGRRGQNCENCNFLQLEYCIVEQKLVMKF